MSLRSLLSIDFKKYVPGFIINILPKLKKNLGGFLILFLTLTVTLFWVEKYPLFSDKKTPSSLTPESDKKTPSFLESGLDMVGKARDMEGENMQIFAADTKSGHGKIFVFKYDDGSNATAFSAENPSYTSPDFRIVEGQSHDWLVVTTIKNWGTGVLNHIDTWYVVSYWSGNSVVLSYLSDSNLYDGGGTLIYKLTTDASIGADDKSIEIKFIFDDCETQNKCTKTTKVAYYVWDSEKGFFVLDEKKSEISSWEISNLM